jgi:hypothetical protein
VQPVERVGYAQLVAGLAVIVQRLLAEAAALGEGSLRVKLHGAQQRGDPVKVPQLLRDLRRFLR